MIAICEHCKVEFQQVEKGKRKRFCTKKCQQNANYQRHVDYYRKHYQDNRQKHLEVCREYRSRPDVQEKRQGYYQKYKPADQVKRRQRYRTEEWFRSRNRARGTASGILRKVAPLKVCWHCASDKWVNCHHINENPLDNAIGNLSWLCSKCHGIIHSLFREEEKRKISNSIRSFQLQLPTSP